MKAATALATARPVLILFTLTDNAAKLVANVAREAVRVASPEVRNAVSTAKPVLTVFRPEVSMATLFVRVTSADERKAN